MENNGEALYHAAQCAVALKDKETATRLVERGWEQALEEGDRFTAGGLLLIAGEKKLACEMVDEIIGHMESGDKDVDPLVYEMAAILAISTPDVFHTSGLIGKLDRAGLLRAAAFVAAQTGDQEWALRIMRTATKGDIIINEEKSGAFAWLARFDHDLAKEIMKQFQNISLRQDIEEKLICFTLFEAGQIAVILDERATIEAVIKYLMDAKQEIMATFLAGMAGQLQIVQELLEIIECHAKEDLQELHFIIPAEIARLDLESGYETLRMLERYGYDGGWAATGMLMHLNWWKVRLADKGRSWR